LLGAQGLMDARPFQRHLMAAQMASLTDGATEILLDRIGHEFNVS
jgi:alkylation response protein AidB-like acyl-CoA dehydrogenase